MLQKTGKEEVKEERDDAGSGGSVTSHTSSSSSSSPSSRLCAEILRTSQRNFPRPSPPPLCVTRDGREQSQYISEWDDRRLSLAAEVLSLQQERLDFFNECFSANLPSPSSSVLLAKTEAQRQKISAGLWRQLFAQVEINGLPHRFLKRLWPGREEDQLSHACTLFVQQPPCEPRNLKYLWFRKPHTKSVGRVGGGVEESEEKIPKRKEEGAKGKEIPGKKRKEITGSDEDVPSHLISSSIDTKRRSARFTATASSRELTFPAIATADIKRQQRPDPELYEQTNTDLSGILRHLRLPRDLETFCLKSRQLPVTVPTPEELCRAGLPVEALLGMNCYEVGDVRFFSQQHLVEQMCRVMGPWMDFNEEDRGWKRRVKRKK